MESHKINYAIVIVFSALSTLGSDGVWRGADGDYSAASSWESDQPPTDGGKGLFKSGKSYVVWMADGLQGVKMLFQSATDRATVEVTDGGTVGVDYLAVQNCGTAKTNGLHLASGRFVMSSSSTFSLGSYLFANSAVFLSLGPGTSFERLGGIQPQHGALIDVDNATFVVTNAAGNAQMDFQNQSLFRASGALTSVKTCIFNLKGHSSASVSEGATVEISQQLAIGGTMSGTSLVDGDRFVVDGADLTVGKTTSVGGSGCSDCSLLVCGGSKYTANNAVWVSGASGARATICGTGTTATLHNISLGTDSATATVTNPEMVISNGADVACLYGVKLGKGAGTTGARLLVREATLGGKNGNETALTVDEGGKGASESVLRVEDGVVRLSTATLSRQSRLELAGTETEVKVSTLELKDESQVVFCPPDTAAPTFCTPLKVGTCTFDGTETFVVDPDAARRCARAGGGTFVVVAGKSANSVVSPFAHVFAPEGVTVTQGDNQVVVTVKSRGLVLIVK